MTSRTATIGREVSARDITRLLVSVQQGGDAGTFDRLFSLVYTELRQIARRQLRRMRPGETLATTGLVHEAYIKLVDQKQVSWQDRNHFYSIAARAMRQILVNYAEKKQAEKRGGGQAPVTLDEAQVVAPEAEARLLELDAALEHLEQLDPRLSRVVECRFFAGLSENETAAAMGVSRRTVQRDWKLARVWLEAELSGVI